jgi:hypothetical protein
MTLPKRCSRPSRKTRQQKQLSSFAVFVVDVSPAQRISGLTLRRKNKIKTETAVSTQQMEMLLGLAI